MAERLDDDLFTGRIRLDRSVDPGQPVRGVVAGPPPPVWSEPIPAIVDSPTQTTQREIERANGEGSIYAFRVQDDVAARVAAGDLDTLVADQARLRLLMDPDGDPTRALDLAVTGRPVFNPDWKIWIITAKQAN